MTTPTGERGWLSRAVAGFGLASLLSDAGHEAATSALPALLAALGAPPAGLGIIEGVADASASFAKLWGGFLADRPRLRKPLAVFGYFATGVATGAYGLAGSWGALLATRTGGWIARGIRGPARDAMLSDAVPKEALGRAFGFHRAMDSAGAVLGPLFAMGLITLVPLRSVFAFAMVPGLLAALAFALLVRPQKIVPRETLPFWHSLGALPPPFRRFLAAVFFFGLGDFARTLLILRASQLLTPAQGAVRAAALAMLLYAVHNLLYSAASYPVGFIADRISPRLLLVTGYLLGAITAALAAFASASMAMLALLFIVGGIALAFVDTLEGMVTARVIDSSRRGTAYGVLAAVNGVGDLLSSALVGVAWSVFGPTWAFGSAAVFCLLGSLLVRSALPTTSV